eukprot:259616_1
MTTFQRLLTINIDQQSLQNTTKSFIFWASDEHETCNLCGICSNKPYTISFNEEERIVSIYYGRNMTRSIPFDEFKQLSFKVHRKEFSGCCFLGCYWVSGTVSYCGATVYIQLKNGQKQEINQRLCIGDEILEAQCLVEAVNQYYKAQRENDHLERDLICIASETGDDEGSDRIPIGSCCYVDCETAFGVVIGYLPDNAYKIVDLFEKTQRRAYGNRLTVITDRNVFNEVNRQYQQYLMAIHR